MALPWQYDHLSITSALANMMKKEIIVDVVFKKGKTPCLYAHKLIMSVWSPYFADLMKQSDKNSPLTIVFNEDIDVMQAILEYIYSNPGDYVSSDNCFTKMPVEKLIQALEITERFDIKQINQRCLSSLQRRKIDPMNVIQFLDYGLRKNLETIVHKCVKVLTYQGTYQDNLSDHISVSTVIALLTLDKITSESEANLLSLALSWLSHPVNKCYKSEVLSFVDLSSIDWAEYERVWKKFPKFFSETELSSILLAVAQQNVTLFPDWYTPRISSAVKRNCDVCLVAHKRLDIPKFHFAKWNYARDLKDISQAFEFDFKNSVKARLVSVELNVGPNDIPESEFMLKFSRNGISHWKDCRLDYAQQNNKYAVLFQEPVMLKNNDSVTLRFHFTKGLLENKIQIFMPNIIQRQKVNETLKKGCVKVELKFSRLALHCGDQEDLKFLVSSFCFNFCDRHNTYLVRKRVEPKPNESIIKRDLLFRSNIPKIELFDVNIKKEKMWVE